MDNNEVVDLPDDRHPSGFVKLTLRCPNRREIEFQNKEKERKKKVNWRWLLYLFWTAYIILPNKRLREQIEILLTESYVKESILHFMKYT